MVKKRIAISGKIASGKTTLSQYIMQKYGHQRISFSEPVKWIAEDWFRRYSNPNRIEGLEELDRELFRFLVKICSEDYSLANRIMNFLLDEVFPNYMDIDWRIEKNEKWRLLLQAVGNETLAFYPTIWADALARRLEENELYICDDLRYKHEYEVLKENNFTIIRLDVSAEVQAKRIKNIYGELDTDRLIHRSEVELDNFFFKYQINADLDLHKVLQSLEEIIQEK